MIAADPNRPEGHFALGVALLHQGHYQDALTAYAAADRCDPSYAPTLYNIGYIYEKLGNFVQAAHWYERTLQHDAKYFDVTTLPRLFKLRIDSDISTPYGDPMQGLLIYLNQGNAPGILVNTLGLGIQPPKTK